MYARVVMFTGASKIDEGVDYLRDVVTPILRQQKGYRGTFGSADRNQGTFGVLTLWESEADRDASDSALAKVRDEAVRITGGTLNIELYEAVLQDAVGPPSTGAALLLRRVSMEPGRVTENLEFFSREILPQIQQEPGYLATRQMINRQTGEGVVSTVWKDAASRRAAAESAVRRQQQSAGRVTFGEQSEREVVFVDVP